eukprot:g4034.t1
MSGNVSSTTGDTASSSSIFREFCAADRFATLKDRRQGVSFSLEEFSPCVNDVVIIGIANVVLVLACIVRLCLLFSSKENRYQLAGLACRVAQVVKTVAAFGIVVLTLMQFSGHQGTEDGGLLPFEVIAFVLTMITWTLTGILYIVEKKRYFQSYTAPVRFASNLQAAAYAVKAYYVFEYMARKGEPLTFFKVLFLCKFLAVCIVALVEIAIIPSLKNLAPTVTSRRTSLVEEKDGDDGSSGKVDQSAGAKDQICPEHDASICSRLWFTWMTPMISTGYKRPLVESDVWELHKADTSATQQEVFETHWNVELDAIRAQQNVDAAYLEKGGSRGRKHLFRAFRRTFCCKFSIAVMWKLPNDLSQFAGPLVMKQIISYVQSQASDDPDDPFEAYALAFVLFFTLLLGAVGEAQYFQNVMRIGMYIRSIVTTSVYDKSLRLSAKGRKGRSDGKIASLVGSDANSLQTFMQQVVTLFSAPLRITISLILIYQELQWAAFAGISVLIIAIPIQRSLVRKSMRLMRLSAKATDKRVKLCNEGVQTMSILKLYGWEHAAQDRITRAREEEMMALKNAKYLSLVNSTLTAAVPILVTVISFVFYACFIGKLTAEKVFVSMTLFNILRMPLWTLPRVIDGLSQAAVALDRISDFLLADELAEDDVASVDRKVPAIRLMAGSKFAWDADASSPSFSVPGDHAGGKHEDVVVHHGETIAIVGATGQGKSSCIGAVLGDAQLMRGGQDTAGPSINGSFAYVPQEAWIFNGTVRENVLFGRPYVEELYAQAVRDASLEHDILSMGEAGDMTEIGEGGVNLSGGQRQRLSIARALYADADVYILDDPLSALDAKVAREIYDNAICKRLREKTVLLVTNRVEFVGSADRIWMIDDGHIVGDGNYANLIESCGPFAELMSGVADLTLPNDESSRLDSDENNDEKKSNTDAKSPSQNEAANDSKPAEKDAKQGSLTTAQRREKGMLTHKEHRDVGHVKFNTILFYAKAMGGPSRMVLLGLITVFTGASGLGMTKWLEFWVSNVEGQSFGLGFYLGIYTLFCAFKIFANTFKGFSELIFGLRASKSLHGGLIRALLRAPMSFFHSTPVGRITNRFTSDFSQIDKMLVYMVSLYIGGLMQLSEALIGIGQATPMTLLAFTPVFFGFGFLQRYFGSTNRELKRLDAVSKSPVLANIMESLGGISTIRAFRRQAHMRSKADDALNKSLKMNFALFSSNRWLATRIELLGGLITLAAALFVIVAAKQIGPATAG